MIMENFELCAEVNELLESHKDFEARNKLIILLDKLKREKAEYTPLVNHLIRRTGLFPYIKLPSSSWEDRFIFEAFKVDSGFGETATLHLEQSNILSRLIKGESLAVSAPTSFGKSFVIDSFISIREPDNVLIIVPTLALTDETRRRLQRKFSDKYNIITTTEITEFGGKNIFIFPQERAISYVNKLEKIDMLIVDEFYKASADFDKSRSPVLMRAIIHFSSIAKQRYFLAPNISTLKENIFTRGMNFISLDFNTVALEIKNLYLEIGGDLSKKEAALKKILQGNKSKTLIYAGSHAQISKVSDILISFMEPARSKLLSDFSEWLAKNYGASWKLPKLASLGIGIHNGQMHRSLSQIQVRLFEEEDALATIISTSSIIEGVNTSAEKVVLWNNKNGSTSLTDFEYKNVIGRGGRMFKHFVGHIYALEKPPSPMQTQLQINLPDSLLGLSDINILDNDLTFEQKEKSSNYRRDIAALIGERVFEALQLEGKLQSSDTVLLKKIITEISSDPLSWNSLAYLNSPNPEDWVQNLYRAINIDASGWDSKFSKIVFFVKAIYKNWTRTIPQLLSDLSDCNLTVDEFFKLERIITYKLSSLLGDINAIHEKIAPERRFDISPFIFKLSHAFLPPLVYQLEEYGLPRIISRKIHNAGVIDFESSSYNIKTMISKLKMTRHQIENSSQVALDDFDKYLLNFFFDGVTSNADNFSD
jgi:DEAD/DEAH box helicase